MSATVNAIDTVLARMATYGDRSAVVWKGQEQSYTAFLARVAEWEWRFGGLGIGAGTVVAVLGEFSPKTCALFFALMKAKAIIVPLTRAVSADELQSFMAIAGAQVQISLSIRKTSRSWPSGRRLLRMISCKGFCRDSRLG